MTYQELLRHMEDRLKSAGIEEYKEDAWRLFSECFQMGRSSYFIKNTEPLSVEHEKKGERLSEWLKKRMQHIPLQYILGKQEFMGLEFLVNENVLVPRFDTELLVEEVCKYSKGKRILDVCTGSGCIAVAVAVLGEPLSVDALDISADALQVACENAKRQHADITFYESDLFTNIKGNYDCIVSNPPYIESECIDGLAKEVAVYEPRLALDGGEDGLDFYRVIIMQAKEHLSAGGRLFLEIGCNQGNAVLGLLEAAGYGRGMVKKDYAGLDRVVSAVWKKENPCRMEEQDVR